MGIHVQGGFVPSPVRLSLDIFCPDASSYTSCPEQNLYLLIQVGVTDIPQFLELTVSKY